MPSLNDGQLAGLASAAAKKATEASGVGHSVGERPLTAGMTVLVALLLAFFVGLIVAGFNGDAL